MEEEEENEAAAMAAAGKKGAGALLASFLLAALASPAFVVSASRSGPVEKASQGACVQRDLVLCSWQ